MRLCATFSTSGSSYLNVALTTVHHLYNVKTAITTQVCSASYLGSQHNATHRLGRRQISIDSRYTRSAGVCRSICCPRPNSVANPPHVATAVERRDVRQTVDRRTDGQTTDRYNRLPPCDRHRQTQGHSIYRYSVKFSKIQ